MIILWDEINLVREESGPQRSTRYFAAKKQLMGGRFSIGLISSRLAFSSAKRVSIRRAELERHQALTGVASS
jgi:hypothetical protein